MTSKNKLFCRFCLQNNNLMGLSNCTELMNKIKICLNIQFLSTTKSRIHICNTCVKIIDDFYDYRMMCHRNMNTVNTKVKEKPSFTNHKSESKIYYEFLQENHKPEEHSIINENESETNNKQKQLTNEYETKDSIRDESPVSYTEGTIQKNEESENEQKVVQERPKKNYIYPSKRLANHLCQMCGKFIRDIRLHLRTHSDNKEFECKLCTLKYKQIGNLRAHMKIHNNIRDFKCEICSKDFPYRESLKKHMYTHTGEKKYKCEFCERSFSTTSGRLIHMKHHMQDRKFECSYCQKKFITKYYLSKHLRIHTGEKPYQCKFCDKKFAYIWNMKTHLRTHTKEKPYKCEFCIKAFSHQSSYKEHIKVHQ